jgi:FAD/FMN-containing dehydrogenase/Fe-S oxidoreductase
MSDLEQQLQRALNGEVRFDLYSRVLYSTDASSYQIMPVGVVLPRAADEIAALVSICARHGAPVLARGAGSSLAGQAVGAAVHVDFSKYLCNVLEVNAEERWVRCEPGVNCDALNAQLKPYGLMFGPDPASSNRATVGGMIANNSTGAHSILYGMAGDHIRSARVVLSDGTPTTFEALTPEALAWKMTGTDLEGDIYRAVMRLLYEHRAALRDGYPRTWRRASGYSLNYLLPPDERTQTLPPAWRPDAPAWAAAGRPADDGFNLARLLASSEGTLAVATEITLGLVPRPRMTALDVVHFDDLIAAAAATEAILECGPSAIELIDDTMINLARGVPAYARMLNWVHGRPRAALVVEFYGDSEAELLAQVERLEAHLRAQGVAQTFVRALTPAQQADVWGVRKVGLGLLSSVRGDYKALAFMEDVAVPVERLAEYLSATQRIFAEHHLESAVYAHASAGCLHIRPRITLKTADGVATMRAVAEAVLDEVVRLRGSMSGEHGDGLSRSEWNARLFGSALYEAFRELKRAFDPRALLNPGKVVNCPPMDTNLRYGADYHAEQPATRLDFTLEDGLAGAVEQCNGAAVCRQVGIGTMCPSYMATRDELHSTRGRANALRAALTGRLPRAEVYSERMYEAFDLCLECKGCKGECPSGVDIAKVKYEWLARYQDAHGVPLRSRVFANIHQVSRLGAALAPLANSPLTRLAARRLGVHPARTLPAFASEPFDRWFARRSVPPPVSEANGGGAGGGRRRVVLFHDTFTTYNVPEIGRAAVAVLEAAGFAVELVAKRMCCGRPMISKGLLDQARAALAHNVALLAPYAEQGIPIVGLEPSCILTFRDEGPDLLKGDTRAKLVGQGTLLLEELLDVGAGPGVVGAGASPAPTAPAQAGQGQALPLQTRGRVLVHGHCHQKALVGTAPLLRVLRAAGYDASEINAGCCGMAGSFGYEREHYEISMKIGEDRLLPAVRAAAPDTLIVAAGFSCRQQIAHGTGRRALHPAEALALALESHDPAARV